MATFDRRLARPTCLVLLVLATGCPSGPAEPSGREKGVRDAQAAIAAGELKLKEYPPLPSPAAHGEYIQLLRERCDVGYEVPAKPPGLAEAVFAEEVRGWNDTMEAEINRKFGAGILGRLHQEARERWEAKVKGKGKG
ncbi:MAG TPA: hypothetical protein VKD90_17035 [Gemmataceae bacterium]|nr:hypothetical protein [Gemmataceae bacterium]